MLLLSSSRSCYLLFALAATAAGCKRPAPPAPPPPPQVTVSRPIQRPIVEHRDFTGRIEAVETVEVRARVRGFLQKVLFKEGVEVKKGDLLYEIDPRTFQAEVDRTKADVARLESQLKLATSEAERAERLIGSNAISREEYLQKIVARDSARAALQQARAAAESAQLELSFTKIYAPIGGRIGRTLVTEGNLVGSNEPTLLTTIVQMDPVYVYFETAERNFLEYGRLIREQEAATAAEAKVPVSVGLANEEGYPHEGVIDFRDNRVDPGTGTMLLRGVLPNPDRILTPGLFARVRVPIGKPRERLLVPEAALSADQRGRYVLVVNADNEVEHRPVETGPTLGGLVVIAKGLKPDDWLIINGLQRARPGAKVEPQRAEHTATGARADKPRPETKAAKS